MILSSSSTYRWKWINGWPSSSTTIAYCLNWMQVLQVHSYQQVSFVVFQSKQSSIPDLTRECSNHASSGQRLDSRRCDSHDEMRRDQEHFLAHPSLRLIVGGLCAFNGALQEFERQRMKCNSSAIQTRTRRHNCVM